MLILSRILFTLFALVMFIESAAAQRTKIQKKSSSASAKTYVMNAAQSQITLTLTQEGALQKIHPLHHVAAKNFGGRIQLPTDESKTSVELDADTKSFVNIDTDMKDFEKSGFHKVLHGEVLRSDQFPSIKFRSVSVTNIQKFGNNRSFTLNGDLTLRGVTRRVAFPVKVTLNGNQLRATGEENIKQTDFNITPYSGGLGTIKIGDQLKVSFIIIATGN
jgi:polyisoprenoid-binding protein YceI